MSSSSLCYPKPLPHQRRVFFAREKITEERERERMGVATKAGDWAFKAFTAGLGVATIYLTATFSVNVYRGLVWHNSQSKMDKAGSDDQTP